jgi:hypothetical protein
MNRRGQRGKGAILSEIAAYPNRDTVIKFVSRGLGSVGGYAHISQFVGYDY